MAGKFKLMAEYTLALLVLLDKEGPLPTRSALQRFEITYRDWIPEDMYGLTGKELKWSNRVRWERLNLARLGLMGNDQKGIWYLTDDGHQFLLNHPTDALQRLQILISLDAERAKEERQKRGRKSEKNTSISAIEKPFLPKGIDKKISPPQNENKSPVLLDSSVNYAHQKLDQDIQIIFAYLHGKSALQPSSELICDWVHFCYNFSLYAEGLELFTLISSSEVNPWYFERTQKIARLCGMKAHGHQA